MYQITWETDRLGQYVFDCLRADMKILYICQHCIFVYTMHLITWEQIWRYSMFVYIVYLSIMKRTNIQCSRMIAWRRDNEEDKYTKYQITWERILSQSMPWKKGWALISSSFIRLGASHRSLSVREGGMEGGREEGRGWEREGKRDGGREGKFASL